MHFLLNGVCGVSLYLSPQRAENMLGHDRNRTHDLGIASPMNKTTPCMSLIPYLYFKISFGILYIHIYNFYNVINKSVTVLLSCINTDDAQVYVNCFALMEHTQRDTSIV